MTRLLLMLLLLPVFAKAQNVTTFAGGGSSGLGDGGPATAAGISDPMTALFDKMGNCYIVSGSGHRIRKIDTSGIIVTVAGTGVGGYGGDGFAATAAKLNVPRAVAFDTLGNLYIADGGNAVVRKVNALTGVISTFAGTGTSGYNGDGIPATAAMLNNPNDICFDKSGNLYIADGSNNRVRKINAAGTITTVAGNGTYGFSGDGGPATIAQLWEPWCLALDDTDNLYISDLSNFRIRKVNTAGIITTYAGSDNNIYGGDGIPATNARFYPEYIRLNSSGELAIGDFSTNYRVLMVDNAGIIHSVAGNGIAGHSGDGGPATGAEFYYPAGVAFDRCDNLYVTDINDGRVRKVTYNSTCDPYGTSPTLNIKSIQSNLEFTVCPNPTTTTLNISASDRIASIAISNLLGQTAYSHDYTTEKVQIDVSDLPSGVYLIRINGTEVRKFVKQ